MSWLISRALMEDYENSRSSLGLVAEYSEDTCSDGQPSLQSSGSLTPQAYCSPDRMTAFSRLSRFGMTFAPLTADRSEVLLTWYLAGFRARTSPSPEVVTGSTASAADSGEKCSGSLARFDQSSHTLKTAQGSLFSDSTESCVILPRSGSMRNGECFQRPTLERPMIATAYGSSHETFPTPTVCENYNRKGASAKSGDGLATYVKKFPTPTASAMPCEGTVRLCRKLWLDGDASLEEASAIAGRDVRKSQGKVPALGVDTCSTANFLGAMGAQIAKARKFPTPTATAYKGWSKNHNRADTDDRLDYTVEREAAQGGNPGRLNPEWEEWLMGWPLGWTALNPLEMGRFLEWRQNHSPLSALGGDGDA